MKYNIDVHTGLVRTADVIYSNIRLVYPTEGRDKISTESCLSSSIIINNTKYFIY